MSDSEWGDPEWGESEWGASDTPVAHHATFQCDVAVGASFDGHRHVHGTFKSDTQFGADFASRRGLHRSFQSDTHFGAAFSSQGKIFEPLFVSSFDSASPLAVWTPSSGATIVTGRDGNGATPTPFHSLTAEVSGFYYKQLFNTTYSGGVIGFAANFSQLFDGPSPVVSVQIGSLDNTFLVQLEHLGDGRFMVQLLSSVGNDLAVVMPSTNTTLGIPGGFITYNNECNFCELGVYTTKVVTPGGVGLPDGVALTVIPYLRMNNELVWTGLLGAGGLCPPDTEPDIKLGQFALRANVAVYDDVYANGFVDPTTDFLGDCLANSDDLTVEILPAVPDITQALAEVAFHDAAPLILTQAVMEVAFNNTAPLLLTQVVMEVAFSRTRPPSYAHTRGAHARTA